MDLVKGGTLLVGVEAAAGAGKTHLACELALAGTADLAPWQSVLFLSHTNAARDVFRNRVTADRRSERITLRTLDSFAMEVLSPYATLLGLPTPLRPPKPMPRDWFKSIRKKTAFLLQRKRPIANAVAARFPLILADEHQDASRQHHAILTTLAAAGSRVRLFGDALQAILTFDPDIPGWDTLMEAVQLVPLSGSWRWAANPDLGVWIEQVRTRLRSRQPIRLDDCPACVRVEVVDDLATGSWLDNDRVRVILGESSRLTGLMILTRRNDEARVLCAQSDLEIVVNEGADPTLVDQFIEEALRSSGDLAEVAEILIDFMREVGTLPEETIRSLLDRDRSSPHIVQILDELEASPDLGGLIRAARVAYRCRHALEWNLSHPLALDTVRRLPVDIAADDVRELVFRAQRATAEAPLPTRCASTIHKAKGRECSHVILPCVDTRTFQDKVEDRQLLYVALSRAKETVTLIIPRQGASPLVTFP
jgi:hypothetical protein